jgi:hypothetical protein
MTRWHQLFCLTGMLMFVVKQNVQTVPGRYYFFKDLTHPSTLQPCGSAELQ